MARLAVVETIPADRRATSGSDDRPRCPPRLAAWLVVTSPGTFDSRLAILDRVHICVRPSGPPCVS